MKIAKLIEVALGSFAATERGQKLIEAARGFAASERGQTLVEYALIISVLSIGTVCAMLFLRGELAQLFSSFSPLVHERREVSHFRSGARL